MIVKDNNGNVILAKYDDGYEERNTYNDNGKLIREEIKFPNGIVEINHYNN